MRTIHGEEVEENPIKKEIIKRRKESYLGHTRVLGMGRQPPTFVPALRKSAQNGDVRLQSKEGGVTPRYYRDNQWRKSL